MSKPSFKVTRRNLLKGSGAALALPLLPALSASAQAGVYPKRLLLFVVPEGMEPSYWWPSTTGTNFQLSNSLTPLAGHRSDLTLIKGVHAESTKAFGGCYHNFAMPHILSGGPNGPSINYSGINTAGGITINRFIGRHQQGPSAFQSYELGIQVGNTEIQRVTTFDGKGMGRESVCNPYKAFNDLSGQASTSSSTNLQQYYQRKKSVLDSVLNELNTLRCKVGAEGKQKLDAHTESVRAVEKQLQVLANSGGNFKDLVTVASSWNSENNHMWNQDNYPAVGKLQMDMAVAALQTDLTRSITIQWSSTVSYLSFPWLTDLNLQGRGHHDISHDTSAEAIQDKRRIAAWYAEQFAYLLGKLKQVPEGAGTLLDNTLVVYISEMSNPAAHDANNLPIILAGGLQNKINKGQYIDYSSLGSRTLGDLWTTVAQAFGIGINSFGETQYNKKVLSEVLK